MATILPQYDGDVKLMLRMRGWRIGSWDDLTVYGQDDMVM